MANVLDKIVADKRIELEQRKAHIFCFCFYSSLQKRNL